MALSACAPDTAQLQSRPDLAPNASTEAPEASLCRPSPALLASQPAPDCAFRRSDLKTIDPDQWARLKIEYERQCYREAEKTVRERLRQLQAANKCETDSARRS